MSEDIKQERTIPESTPVHIKMKVGTIEFEIICDENQVQDIIKKASEKIIIPKRSKRNYPFGAALPRKMRRKLA